MAIVLGDYTFDGARTAVSETHEEAGGRDARVIEITGVLDGFGSTAALEDALDTILAAASVDEDAACLSLRPGRRLAVRRLGFERQVVRGIPTGSFALKLAAEDPFEESETVTTVLWSISTSGTTQVLSTSGNVFAAPKLSLVASGTVLDPAFGDGERSLVFAGSVADGETLEVDAAAGRVMLAGENVTPYTAGDFPRVGVSGTTLTYTDDAESSHAAAVTITYRDRWW